MQTYFKSFQAFQDILFNIVQLYTDDFQSQNGKIGKISEKIRAI